MVIEYILLFCLFFILHTYVFYPLSLIFLKSKKKFLKTDTITEPSVSVVISAYNEESVIRQRIQNLLQQNYPKEKVQLLIGSDCSTDRTNEIVKEYVINNVQLVEFKERRGKPAVINDLMKYVTNDIVIFSDANTFYHENVIRNFVRHFTSQDVGGVCGYLQLRSKEWNSGGKSESMYWEYENLIKKLEGEIQTTFGATGAVYAIRKNLFIPLPTHKAVADDFYIPMRIVEQGYRVIYDKEIFAWEETTESSYTEFQRKIRIGAANYNCLSDFWHLLHPRNGFVAYGFFSHKILRWFVPLLLIVIFLVSLYSLDKSSTIYYMFLTQLVFIIMGAFGFVLDRVSYPIKLFTLTYYFIITNIALMIGLLRAIRGTEKPMWRVTR